MWYRYEMHLHTAPCSLCAVATMEEMVAACREKGYAGFVVTNHFYHGNTGIDRSLSWEAFVEAYAEDWRRGVELAKPYDIDVIFGLEEVYRPGKEVLIYGLTPEEIAAAPFLREKDLPTLSAYVREKGGVLAHAHPYRIAPYIAEPDWVPDPSYLDFVEVFNANGTQNRNELAQAYAKANGLPATAGGDVHRTANFGLAGIAFDHRVRDGRELVAALKAGGYHLIRNGEIAEETEETSWSDTSFSGN